MCRAVAFCVSGWQLLAIFSRIKIVFSWIVFGGSPYCLYFPLLPLRAHPTVKCHPRWQTISGQQSTVGWGDCWIQTQDCSVTIWCRYHWFTTAPIKNFVIRVIREQPTLCAFLLPHCFKKKDYADLQLFREWICTFTYVNSRIFSSVTGAISGKVQHVWQKTFANSKKIKENSKSL